MPLAGTQPNVEAGASRGLAVGRIGILGGLTGILCCVGLSALALLGVIGGQTAFLWANDLYDGYKWWFRLAGLVAMTVVVWWSLRRRRMCTLQGLRDFRFRLLLIVAVAVATYAGLYAVTTWLGTLA